MKITIGDLTRAVAKFLPYISEEMIRNAVEDGSLPAWRNPRKRTSWYFIHPTAVVPFLMDELKMSKPQIKEVWATLKNATAAPSDSKPALRRVV